MTDSDGKGAGRLSRRNMFDVDLCLDGKQSLQRYKTSGNGTQDKGEGIKMVKDDDWVGPAAKIYLEVVDLAHRLPITQ